MEKSLGVSDGTLSPLIFLKAGVTGQGDEREGGRGGRGADREALKKDRKAIRI